MGQNWHPLHNLSLNAVVIQQFLKKIDEVIPRFSGELLFAFLNKLGEIGNLPLFVTIVPLDLRTGGSIEIFFQLQPVKKVPGGEVSYFGSSQDGKLSPISVFGMVFGEQRSIT